MSRVIRKSHLYSSRDAADLLANLFLAELLVPSQHLWLVSPWISNVSIIDNAAGSFDDLVEFGPRFVRLSEVLSLLASRGTSIVVGTTADDHNTDFITKLQSAARDRGCAQRVRVVIDVENLLHEKAITSDDYAVVGSMNITFNGISVREEYLELRMDEEFVARARLDALDRFGSAG